MWEDAEADFLLLGIKDDDYWGLPPSVIMRVAKLKREQIQSDAEEKLEMSTLTAMLTAIGINNPKNFPNSFIKKPIDDYGGVDNTAASILALKNKYK